MCEINDLRVPRYACDGVEASAHGRGTDPAITQTGERRLLRMRNSGGAQEKRTCKKPGFHRAPIRPRITADLYDVCGTAIQRSAQRAISSSAGPRSRPDSVSS